MPALFRAIILGLFILEVGGFISVLPIVGNLKFHPEIPWALPATLVMLAFVWWYFAGGGFPSATGASRRYCVRADAPPPPSRVRNAAVAAILFCLVSMISLRLLMPSVAPVAVPSFDIDISPYPTITVIGLSFSVAITAGVTEELAFRGYMQRTLEDAYGLVPALLIVGVMFGAAHLSHATLKITHLPFHMLVSIYLGLIAYWTRSLLPAIIGHAIGDMLLLPAYAFQKPGFVWDALTARPVWEGAASGPSVGEKVSYMVDVLTSTPLHIEGPHRLFVALALVFGVSTLLASIALPNFSRAAKAAAWGRIFRRRRRAPLIFASKMTASMQYPKTEIPHELAPERSRSLQPVL